MSKLLRLGVPAELGQTLVLSPEVARHVAALRLTAVGTTFDVVDANNVGYAALVTTASPLSVKLVGRASAPNREPAVTITVWVPLLKGGSSEELLRQLTELGVAAIVLYTSAHSVVKLDPSKATKKLARWASIIASATEQCGRIVAPRVDFSRGVPDADVAAGVFLTVMERPTVRAVLAQARSPLSLLVGPEGGLSADEIASLETAGWRGAWLGHRILRAETACLAATTLALHALGEAGY